MDTGYDAVNLERVRMLIARRKPAARCLPEAFTARRFTHAGTARL